MTRQLDKRDFSYVAVPEAGAGGGALESADIPDLDPFTGSIRKVEVDTAGFGEQVLHGSRRWRRRVLRLMTRR